MAVFGRSGAGAARGQGQTKLKFTNRCQFILLWARMRGFRTRRAGTARRHCRSRRDRAAASGKDGQPGPCHGYRLATFAARMTSSSAAARAVAIPSRGSLACYNSTTSSPRRIGSRADECWGESAIGGAFRIRPRLGRCSVPSLEVLDHRLISAAGQTCVRRFCAPSRRQTALALNSLRAAYCDGSARAEPVALR